jgi:O-glycosyl hydrolase
MTYSGCSGGSIDPMQDNLKPEYYEAFCDYLIDVCKHYKDQFGIEFKTLEPFNESTSGYWNYQGSQEGCHFSPETQMKIIRMIYPKLKASSLKTVLSVSDETNIASTIKVLKAYLSAGDIIEKVGQLNTHTYSGTNSERTEVFDLVKTTGKPFWQSETGPGGNKKSSFETNLFLAQKLFDDMRLMKPQAWLDWQLMEESNVVWCLIRCNFNSQKYKIIKNLYVRMQITRFFKQGYTFVETGNEEALAAMNPEKTELVVAVINKSDHEKAFDLNFKAFDKKVKKAVIYRTCSVEDCAKILSFGIRKQAITYSAPGLSLTTFIIPLGN